MTPLLLLLCARGVWQVKKVLEKLYENKKIASATHNIYAYRLVMRLRLCLFDLRLVLCCVTPPGPRLASEWGG